MASNNSGTPSSSSVSQDVKNITDNGIVPSKSPPPPSKTPPPPKPKSPLIKSQTLKKLPPAKPPCTKSESVDAIITPLTKPGTSNDIIKPLNKPSTSNEPKPSLKPSTSDIVKSTTMPALDHPQPSSLVTKSKSQNSLNEEVNKIPNNSSSEFSKNIPPPISALAPTPPQRKNLTPSPSQRKKTIKSRTNSCDNDRHRNLSHAVIPEKKSSNGDEIKLPPISIQSDMEKFVLGNQVSSLLEDDGSQLYTLRRYGSEEKLVPLLPAHPPIAEVMQPLAPPRNRRLSRLEHMILGEAEIDHRLSRRPSLCHSASMDNLSILSEPGTKENVDSVLPMISPAEARTR